MPDDFNKRYKDRDTVSWQDWEIEHVVDRLCRDFPTKPRSAIKRLQGNGPIFCRTRETHRLRSKKPILGRSCCADSPPNGLRVARGDRPRSRRLSIALFSKVSLRPWCLWALTVGFFTSTEWRQKSRVTLAKNCSARLVMSFSCRKAARPSLTVPLRSRLGKDRMFRS
jgi:hypothetical protein